MNRWERERWKILCHRNNYGRMATLSEISECSRALETVLEDLGPDAFKVEVNRTRYPVIWDYYYNQQGGSCQ